MASSATPPKARISDRAPSECIDTGRLVVEPTNAPEAIWRLRPGRANQTNCKTPTAAPAANVKNINVASMGSTLNSLTPDKSLT
jgi:hypothetical protein